MPTDTSPTMRCRAVAEERHAGVGVHAGRARVHAEVHSAVAGDERLRDLLPDEGADRVRVPDPVMSMTTTYAAPVVAPDCDWRATARWSRSPGAPEVMQRGCRGSPAKVCAIAAARAWYSASRLLALDLREESEADHHRRGQDRQLAQQDLARQLA